MVENLVKIKDLTPRSRGVNIIAKVVSKKPERVVSSQYDRSEHRLSEALIADETGAISLVLWDERVDEINEGDTVKISNAFIKLYRGRMQLNLGRFGKVESLELNIPEVNVENNLSERQVGQTGGSFRRTGSKPRFKRTSRRET
ncbi:MAG: OB-fold nucleic acid binding domain-containing protein [Nitrososphaerota archaeon]|nr:OB-fold nucleic acid binding domain-containing protein [Candidatus Geocrenenecus dongiae]